MPITDPGGTHDLYVVFTAANMDLDEFTFQGPGVDRQREPGARPRAPTPVSRLAAADGRLRPPTATDPEGTPVTLRVGLRRRRARRRRPRATASYTYTQRGVYTATVTATDGDGRKSVRTFRIEVLAQCDTGTDQFDGTTLGPHALDERGPRGAVGLPRRRTAALVIDAVAGDMYGGNTSAKNIIGQPAPDGAWTATTKVTLAHVGDVRAGRHAAPRERPGLPQARLHPHARRAQRRAHPAARRPARRPGRRGALTAASTTGHRVRCACTATARP